MTRWQKRERIVRLKALRKRIDIELALLLDDLNRVTETGKRPRSIVPPCGTESAYQRHRWRGEERDAACKAAHALYVKAGRLRRLQAMREAS